MKRLKQVAWHEFQDLSLEEKAPYLSDENKPLHALIAQQFDRPQLDKLNDLTTKIRQIAKSKAGNDYLQSLLSHKRAMLYFTQPSTRTFLSFCSACEILGMRIGEVRNTATSSEFKGESQEDSVRTFSSYFDLIIMRSQMGGLAERMAWVLSNTTRPVPIINAGSGKDQHPTQALLDIYTLQRSFESRGGIDNKSIVFMGDLRRGRTVRSLSALLTHYSGVKQYFVAPDALQISDDVTAELDAAGVQWEKSHSMSELLPETDALYVTRVQDEWDAEQGESSRIDISEYCFTRNHLDLLKPDGIIMHPFPRRTEIADDVDRDPRAMYWRQMRNGMWVRSALIASLFDLREQLMDYPAESE
jgi:aspartate carbamoyltransferase catalytic subunit